MSALSDFDLASAVHSDACVLLTGKKNAVRAVAGRIHTLSGGRRGALTIVDCGGPEEIVERALFGVLAEAETATRPGRPPSAAEAGTILLQDVGRLGPSVQSKLAERLVRLRGRRQPGSPACRVLASTSEPLLPRVLDGTFDDRLFYRLNVIHLVIASDVATEGNRDASRVDDNSLAERGATQDA
jgi:two-component system NtrC family response regulator